MNIPDQIQRSFDQGWTGTADSWWGQHPGVKSINSVAPTFTHLKQAGEIVPAGPRVRTRSGGLAVPFKKAPK